MAIKPDLLETRDYRSYLRDEYAKRCARNTYYSLRAYARDLGISPSRLSDILKGRYGLTERTARTLSAQLKFNVEETHFFWALVESECAKSPVKRKAAHLRVHRYRQPKDFVEISEDIFRFIADWYHLAILELTAIEGFKSDIQHVAQLLNISEDEATDAVTRLFKLNLMKIEDRCWVPTDDFTNVGDNFPSESIRSFHQQMIRLALESIEGQSIQERELASAIMAIAPEDVALAKKEIREFKNRFLKQFGGTEKKKMVYALNIQLFNLTKPQSLAQRKA